MTRVFLGLGANVGDRAGNMRMALRLHWRGCTVVAVSSLYRSEALVLEGQSPGPDFYNVVCEIETELSPQELLAFVKKIEHEIGRRPGERWAPRPIDVDILLYGGEQIAAASLTIPHPALHLRNFVLLPLAEIAPDVMHPELKKLIGEVADDADFAGIEHIAGPEWVVLATGGSFDTDSGVRWNGAEENDDNG